jgi:uncharacterized protein (TIGR00369 family)
MKIDLTNAALDADALTASVPYCAHLGVMLRTRDGRLVLEMPFAEHLIGNPMVPAIHGGVIGSLLETAAISQVIWETGAKATPKPVDITIDFFRTGRPVTSYAGARIAKLGRRVINVHAEMWQDDESKPVAALHGHFLVVAE